MSTGGSQKMTPAQAAAAALQDRYDHQAETGFTLFLAGVLVLFALVSLPRFLVRVLSGRGGQLDVGWKLSKGRRALRQSSQTDSTEKLATSESSYTIAAAHHAPTSRVQPPIHLPSLMPSALNTPVFPRVLEKIAIHVSIGQAILLVFYGALVAVGLTYQAGDDYTIRAGKMATMQVPWIMALACKNNIISSLVGKSYDRLGLLHRWLGRTIFICATVHAALYIPKLTKKVSLGEKLATSTTCLTGFVAWMGLILITVSSLPPIRRLCYQLFFISHQLGFLTFMVSLYLHVEWAGPYVISGFSIYALDLALRWMVKTRVAVAELTALEDGATVVVDIPDLAGGFRAGQHVFIRVISTSMGRHMLASHPFTIANSAEAGEGVRLMMKSCGGWTKALYACAGQGDKEGDPRKVRVMVDGPYGGPGHLCFTSFSSVLLVGAGSGISFVFSVAQSLLSRSLVQGACRASNVNIVWMVKNETSVQAFLPYIVPLLRTRSPTLQLTFRVWVTQQSVLSGSRLYAQYEGLEVHTGRPDLEKIFNQELTDTYGYLKTNPSLVPSGLVVGVCGPASVVKRVSATISGLDTAKVGTIGGIEQISEAFGM